MFKEIRKELIERSEKDLQEFNEKLCPSNENKILGIRIPVLRKMAQEIIKKDWKKYIEESEQNADIQYMEERLLEGLVIAYSKIQLDEKLTYIFQFLI